jgi:hypothetical protein
MSRLEGWAEKTLRLVEHGESVARVVLASSDGTIWHTWQAPFAEPEQWATEAETTIAELAAEFAGEIAFVISAQTERGATLSQLPQHVNGRRSKASTGGGAMMGGSTQPVNQIFDAGARTLERVLSTANVQLEVLQRTVQQQAQSNAELLEYIRLSNQERALEKPADAESKELVDHTIKQALEQLPALISLILSRPTNGVAGVGQAIEKAAVDTATHAATAVVQNVAARRVAKKKG